VVYVTCVGVFLGVSSVQHFVCDPDLAVNVPSKTPFTKCYSQKKCSEWQACKSAGHHMGVPHGCITWVQPDLCSFRIAMKSGAAALICRNMGNLKLAASSKCLLNHFCWVSLSQNSNLGRQTTVKIWQMESAMPCVQTQDHRCFRRMQSRFNTLK